MGFRVGSRVYVLHFGEGTYFDGAEIKVRPASIATVEQVESSTYSDGFKVFLDHVESWNLERPDGSPLPVDVDACVQVMEVAERRELIDAWLSAAYGVSAPLNPPSGDGGRSPDGENVALSIPMELLSPPQTN